MDLSALPLFGVNKKTCIFRKKEKKINKSGSSVRLLEFAAFFSHLHTWMQAATRAAATAGREKQRDDGGRSAPHSPPPCDPPAHRCQQRGKPKKKVNE